MGDVYFLIRRDIRTVYELNKSWYLRQVFGDEQPIRMTSDEVDTAVDLILAAERGDLDGSYDVTHHRVPDDDLPAWLSEEQLTAAAQRAADDEDAWCANRPSWLSLEDEPTAEAPEERQRRIDELRRRRAEREASERTEAAADDDEGDRERWRRIANDIVDWSEGQLFEFHSEHSPLLEEIWMEGYNPFTFTFRQFFITGGIERVDLADRRRIAQRRVP